MSSTASPLAGMLARGVHTVGYLAVTGLVAWAFYRKLGLALIRKTWFNFNLVWGVALVATACSRCFDLTGLQGDDTRCYSCSP